VVARAGPGENSGGAATAPRAGSDAGDEPGPGAQRGRGTARGTAGKPQTGVRRDALRIEAQAECARHV